MENVYNDESADCKSCLDYISIKDDSLILKCPKCNKNHDKDFNKELSNRFGSTYEFCEGDINKFILLLKSVYAFKYIDSWERFDETLLPNKEDFYSSLNMEGITDRDYRHAKKLFKEFKMNNLRGYLDLYAQSDAILLVYVENFRNKCIEIYQFDPAHFLSAWINMVSMFKK